MLKRLKVTLKLVMNPVIVHTNRDIKLGNVRMQPQKKYHKTDGVEEGKEFA
jgi:hypothetical protein